MGLPAGILFIGARVSKGAIMSRVLAIIAVVFVGSATTAAAQDVGAGEQSFRKCLPCHSVGADARNKVGPVLNGLDGRKSGTIEGYSYSDANKNSGITWSVEAFKEYIKDPRARIPGTKMVFAGIKNEKEINDLWAYLSQFKANGEKN
jgi:cytochrome c